MVSSICYVHSFSFSHSTTKHRFENRRDFRFDDTFQALVTLFEVLTLEGWLDVRDVFEGNTKFNSVCVQKEKIDTLMTIVIIMNSAVYASVSSHLCVPWSESGSPALCWHCCQQL